VLWLRAGLSLNARALRVGGGLRLRTQRAFRLVGGLLVRTRRALRDDGARRHLRTLRLPDLAICPIGLGRRLLWRIFLRLRRLVRPRALLESRHGRIRGAGL
jgi:hypothetical protein